MFNILFYKKAPDFVLKSRQKFYEITISTMNIIQRVLTLIHTAQNNYHNKINTLSRIQETE